MKRTPAADRLAMCIRSLHYATCISDLGGTAMREKPFRYGPRAGWILVARFLLGFGAAAFSPASAAIVGTLRRDKGLAFSSLRCPGFDGGSIPLRGWSSECQVRTTVARSSVGTLPSC